MDRPSKPRPRLQAHTKNACDTQEQYDAERALEGSILRLARSHAAGIETIDLMDLVRDIVNAADECRCAGTTQQSVTNIIEDTFGAYADKEADRGANKAAASESEKSD